MSQSTIANLSVMGPVRMQDGIGAQGPKVLELLEQDGLKINYYLLGKERGVEGISPKNLQIIRQPFKDFGRVVLFEHALTKFACKFSLFNFPKRSFVKDLHQNSRYPLGRNSHLFLSYTMFESSRIPKLWLKVIDKYFDALVVPDPSMTTPYRESGVKKPIFELPLTMTLDDYLVRPIKKEPSSPFTFVTLGMLEDRKDQATLIKAFAEAFGQNPNVRLVINGRRDHRGYGKKLRDLVSQLDLANITLTEKCLSDSEYKALLSSADCLVNISKGEGFSYQPREAMALGIPSILSDTLAQSSLCQHPLVLGVKPSIQEPFYARWVPGERGPCGYQYACTVGDVAKALKKMYEQYDSFLAHSESGREWVKQFQAESLHGSYLAMVQPKTLVFGKENKIFDGGIETSSKKLYEKLVKLFPEATTHC